MDWHPQMFDSYREDIAVSSMLLTDRQWKDGKGGGGECTSIGSLYELETNVFIIEEKKL